MPFRADIFAGTKTGHASKFPRRVGLICVGNWSFGVLIGFPRQIVKLAYGAIDAHCALVELWCNAIEIGKHAAILTR